MNSRDQEAEGGSESTGMTPSERFRLRRIYEFLGFADLIAVLMVLATAMSAFATWRTARIAGEILLVSERPYIGVQSLSIDTSHPHDPRVQVVYRNFGHVQAWNVVMGRKVKIGGKDIPQLWSTMAVGVISPEAPHRLHLHVPSEAFAAATAGRTQLEVEVGASYEGPSGRRLCYLENFRYVPDSGYFEVDGGSILCNQEAAEFAGRR